MVLVINSNEFCRTHYPLVVKLGTITTNADAIDVYSYDEDDAVMIIFII